MIKMVYSLRRIKDYVLNGDKLITINNIEINVIQFD